jgi:hypothetical protein
MRTASGGEIRVRMPELLTVNANLVPTSSSKVREMIGCRQKPSVCVRRLLDGYCKVTGDGNLRGPISGFPVPGYDW